MLGLVFQIDLQVLSLGLSAQFEDFDEDFVVALFFYLLSV